MDLQPYRVFLLVVTAVLALLVASPAIQKLLVAPQTEHLTEFSVLGAYHNATYPFNVKIGENHRLYLDVGNQLGNCSYYVIKIKFRNQSQSSPDSFAKTPSYQSALANLRFFAADGENLELPIDVAFYYELDENVSKLNMERIVINGAPLEVDTVIDWDTKNDGFYGYLFFELWIFDDDKGDFQYHQRYISLRLKLNV